MEITLGDVIYDISTYRLSLHDDISYCDLIGGTWQDISKQCWFTCCALSLRLSLPSWSERQTANENKIPLFILYGLQLTHHSQLLHNENE